MDRFFKVKSESPAGQNLYLFGVIGDEITPIQVKMQLDTFDSNKPVNIFIDSPGGDVFAGENIHNTLKRFPAHKNGYITGEAASIASVVAMAANKIYMPKTAMMFIHNPWSISIGNSKDFRKAADDLDKISLSIIAAYQEKTKLSQEKIIEIMDNETWFTAEEALNNGFIDEIETNDKVYASRNQISKKEINSKYHDYISSYMNKKPNGGK